jgi:S1-C subfamily serine protease
MEEHHHSDNKALFLRQKGEVEGPFDPDDIRELLLRHEISPVTLGRLGEEEKWTPISILLKTVSSNVTKVSPSFTKRRLLVKLVGCVLVISVCAAGLFISLHMFREKQRAEGDYTRAAQHRETLLQESLGKQSSQLEANSKEVENLKSILTEEAKAKKENDERIQRLQAELNEATDGLARETRKSSVLESLSKSLVSDQLKLRESILPAIGIPRDLYLRVDIDPGVLKCEPLLVKAALSRPLTLAGFNIVVEPPTDRQYLLLTYSFAQASNAKANFAAFTTNVRCVGLAWQSGSIRPTILFSEFNNGYAGGNSGYTKAILTEAEVFGEMLVDSLGKIDRDAQATDYEMFDSDIELANAAAKLRSLTSSDEPPVAATGTGFLVSPKGLMVTNHHVIEGHDKVEIWVPSTGKTLTARVIASDQGNDLAFLRVEPVTDLPTDLSFPLIAKSPPDVGQTVFTVGFPVPEIMGREPKFSQGVLNAHSGVLGNIRFLQHSIPIQPGNSGGFLVSEAGEVCGIVQSTLNAMMLLGEVGAIPQNVSYAIKSERLWDFAAAQGLNTELSEGERKPIEAKDALRLSFLITARVK